MTKIKWFRNQTSQDEVSLEWLTLSRCFAPQEASSPQTLGQGATATSATWPGWTWTTQPGISSNPGQLGSLPRKKIPDLLSFSCVLRVPSNILCMSMYQWIVKILLSIENLSAKIEVILMSFWLFYSSQHLITNSRSAQPNVSKLTEIKRVLSKGKFSSIVAMTILYYSKRDSPSAHPNRQ